MLPSLQYIPNSSSHQHLLNSIRALPPASTPPVLCLISGVDVREASSQGAMGTVLVGLAANCLERLAGLLEEQVVMTLRVKRDIKKLHESLKYFEFVREDADAMAMEHRATGIWWKDVKDVMYDVDDIIDLFRVHTQKKLLQPSAMGSSQGSLSGFSWLAQLPFDHWIARRIKGVRERLEEIKKRNDMFISLATNPQPRTITGVDVSVATSIDDIDVVGRDIKEATEEIVKMIVGDGHQRKISVYGILGMGGIGKTTLAQKIYNERRIREKFPEVLIWLSISQSIRETDLLKEAVEKAGGKCGQCMSKDQLQRALLDSISGKSVFLVLDNVTSSDVWVKLLLSPLERSMNAHVLVTTRHHDVLAQMDAIHIQQVHKLKDPDGLELLMKKSFRKEDEISEFSDVGLQFVKKCDGLPLAIKVIAGVLSSRRGKEEWERILERRWSIHGLPPEIQHSLYLSYNDLPPQLKQCFLWCALLPPYIYIQRGDVAYWWVAEGFVKKEGSGSIHEVAEDYYHELIKRNLLHPRPEYIDKAVSTMHDLLRSLGQYLTRDDALFMNTENNEGPSNVRRIGIGNDVEEIPCIEEQKRLRSLLLFHHKNFKSVNIDIYRKLKHLRVLVLCRAGIQRLPESVGHLELLRLLDLSYNEIEELPKSIGNLTSLEYLSIVGCAKLCSLPPSFLRLTILNFLHVEHTGITHVPEGIGKFQEMDNLSSVFQNGGIGFRLDELGTLSKIRHLWVEKLEKATPPTAPVLSDKSYLKLLGLRCTMDANPGNRTRYQESDVKRIEQVYDKLSPSPSLKYIFIEGYPGGKFPEWLSSEPQDTLPVLAHMHFYDCISCPELPPAGQLLALQVLHVRGADAVVSIGGELLGKGVRTPTGTTFFRKLELLEIFNMYNLESWSLSTESLSGHPAGTSHQQVSLMPHLKRLLLINCPKLRALPAELHSVASLQRVLIEGVHSLQEIVGLPGVVWLKVKNNRGLRRISNLSKLQLLLAQDCPELHQAENLRSLKDLYMVDCPMQRQFWKCFLEEQQRMLVHVVTTGAHGHDIYPDESVFH